MGLAVRNQLTHLRAEDVTFVHTDMVEFVDSDQPIVESFDAELLEGEAESRMRADHRSVAILKKFLDRADVGWVYARTVRARRIAEIPLRLDSPVGPEPEFTQRLIGKGTADRAFRHNDDRLFETLVPQLVECDEH